MIIIHLSQVHTPCCVRRLPTRSPHALLHATYWHVSGGACPREFQYPERWRLLSFLSSLVASCCVLIIVMIIIIVFILRGRGDAVSRHDTHARGNKEPLLLWSSLYYHHRYRHYYHYYVIMKGLGSSSAPMSPAICKVLTVPLLSERTRSNIVSGGVSGVTSKVPS